MNVTGISIYVYQEQITHLNDGRHKSDCLPRPRRPKEKVELVLLLVSTSEDVLHSLILHCISTHAGFLIRIEIVFPCQHPIIVTLFLCPHLSRKESLHPPWTELYHGLQLVDVVERVEDEPDVETGEAAWRGFNTFNYRGFALCADEEFGPLDILYGQCVPVCFSNGRPDLWTGITLRRMYLAILFVWHLP